MIRIGKIAATHGLTGAVVLVHIVGDSKWLRKEHVLHIEMHKGSYIPHFMTSVKSAKPDEYLVSLEDVVTLDAAKRLVGKPVYVDEIALEGYVNRSPLLWIGFEIADKKYGNIGTIADVMQTANQWLAKIEYEGKEVLIPLIEQTIVQLDVTKKKLHTDLPEGLLEVYLNS